VFSVGSPARRMVVNEPWVLSKVAHLSAASKSLMTPELCAVSMPEAQRASCMRMVEIAKAFPSLSMRWDASVAEYLKQALKGREELARLPGMSASMGSVQQERSFAEAVQRELSDKKWGPASLALMLGVATVTNPMSIRVEEALIPWGWESPLKTSTPPEALRG